MSESVGTLIGSRYRILRRHASGGMGEIYVAEDIELKRQVAVKLLHDSYGSHPEAVKRFRNEAVAAARVRNPHIVTVLDVGVHDTGQPYLVQELLEGCDLAALVKREGPLDPARAVALMTQACEALAAVHGVGLVHRDIKPANLFLTRTNENEERLVLLDFGIAKVGETLEEGVPVTQRGALMGTPFYLSPEQAVNAAEVDGRSDIYSLGASFYEALTGTPPIPGSSAGEVVVRLHTQQPRRPSELRPMSSELESVLLTCLAKRPDDRFHSAGALRGALVAVPEAHRPPSASGVNLFAAGHADTPTNAQISGGTWSVDSPRLAPNATILSELDASSTLNTDLLCFSQGLSTDAFLPEPSGRKKPAARSGHSWLWRVAGVATTVVALLLVVVESTLPAVVAPVVAALGVVVILGVVRIFRTARQGTAGEPGVAQRVRSPGARHIDVKQPEGPPSPLQQARSEQSAIERPDEQASSSDLHRRAHVTSDSVIGPIEAPVNARTRTLSAAEVSAAQVDARPAMDAESSELDERSFEEFLTQAGLRVVSRRDSVLLLECVAGATLQNLSYAALLPDSADSSPPRSVMATAFFQRQAGALYELRGEPDRQLHAITVVRNLPGRGVYKAWYELATTYHVRVLPVTPQDIARALREGTAPQLVASLVSRIQSNAFALASPITNELDFFGRSQLQQLVGKLLEGRSFALLGLDKWGTTSMMFRIRSEVESRPSAWVDLAALPYLTCQALLDETIQQLGDWIEHNSELGRASLAQLRESDRLTLPRVLQLCREIHPLAPPVLFVDRTDELLRLLSISLTELERCLRQLYALAFPPPDAPRAILVLAGNDDQLFVCKTFGSRGGELRNPLWDLEREYIKFFDQEELADFFGRLGPYSGLSLTDTGLVEAYRKTGGHKYLCRALGSALVQRRTLGASTSTVRARDVDAVIPDIVTQYAHYLEAIFRRAPRKTRRALAHLVHSPLGMLDFLGLGKAQAPSEGGPLSALQFALNFRLVVEEQGKYVLRVGLLGEWLALSGELSRESSPPSVAPMMVKDPVSVSKYSKGTQPIAGRSSSDSTESSADAHVPVPSGAARMHSEFTLKEHHSASRTLLGPSPMDGFPESHSASASPDAEVEHQARSVRYFTTPPPDEQRALRKAIVRACSSEDLQIIAGDLGIRLETIVSTEKNIEVQAMRLIDWSIRNARFGELKSLIQASNGHVSDLVDPM